MSGLPAPIKTDWIKITTEPEILTVVGAGAYWSHWDSTTRKSFRCIGEGCNTCEKGKPPDVRYVLLVSRLGDGRRYWLELRRRHYKLLEIAEKDNKTIIGTRWSVKKEWDAVNARVEITYMDHRPTSEVNVDRFIESLAVRFPSKESTAPPVRHISRLSR